MGCGKTSVGRDLARMVGFAFVDTDDEIRQGGCGKVDPGDLRVRGRGGIPPTRARGPLRHRRARLTGRLHRRRAPAAVREPPHPQGHGSRGLARCGRPRASCAASPGAATARSSRCRIPQPASASSSPERRPVYQEVSDIVIETDGLCVNDVAYGVAESLRVYLAEDVDGERMGG